MNKNSVQIQSVLYNNEKKSLRKALDSLANAVNVNKRSECKISTFTVCYGDASDNPIFSESEIEEITTCFKDCFDFKYKFFGENTGSAKGHNILGEDCQSEFMIIMNPDVVVCPDFFEKIASPIINDTENIIGMTEARQSPVEHPKSYNRVTLETDWATTACALFKTEDFLLLNGFDAKTFFLYCDDLDFSWRLRLMGKKILYIPDCVVFHAKQLSGLAQWQPTKSEVYYSAEAALLLAYKYSANQKLTEIYNLYSKSNDATLLKAVKHFDDLKRNNDLPKQLDPEHKVSKFIGDLYTEHRFKF